MEHSLSWPPGARECACWRAPGSIASYRVPIAASEAPGPIIGLRALDGTWFAGSHLYGPQKIAAYEATIDARGPVFASARIKYEYETGEHLEIRARVVAGQEVVFLESESDAHRPDDGWRLILNAGYPSPVLSVIGEYERNKWGLKWGEIGHVDLAKERAEVLYKLVPWEDWYDGTTRTVFALRSPQSDTVLAIASYDPGAWNDPAWVEPAKRRLYPFVPETHWERGTFKAMPLVKDRRGDIYLECSRHFGVRKWFVGLIPKRADLNRNYFEAAALHDSRYGCQTLDIVKEYVLDWESDPEIIHPRLYISKEDVAEARRKLGSDVAAIEAKFRRHYRDADGKRYSLSGRKLMQYMVDSAYLAPSPAKTAINVHNKFDLMRHGLWLVNMYDALMGTGKLSAQEKKLFRAQIAFLGYRLTSPYVWDIERGYAADPNNMHLSFMTTLALTACAIPDHPKAREWAAEGLKWVRRRMDQHIGENGVWTIENVHYARVSLSGLLPFAIGMRNAGFADLFKDGKLRAMTLYLVKQLTPPNPLLGGVRTYPPAVVQDRGERDALPGAIAKAAARSDPEYSRAMQWAWREQGSPLGIPDNRFGIFGSVVTDANLEAATPAWKSEVFPTSSVILRHGLGTPDEYYLILPICRRPYADYYLPVPGGVTIFAKGEPIVQLMTGAYGESYFANGVAMARTPPATQAQRGKNKGYYGKAYVRQFSGMSRQDYVLGEFHLDQPLRMRPGYVSNLPPIPHWPRLLKEATRGGITWQRQILFIKGASAADVCYFLFRDTVTDSGQWVMGLRQPREPTMWTMWTLSERLGTSEEARDPAAFLANAPGPQLTEPRELEGSRFTALGRFGVDVDYFVALPKTTPRATMRWGYGAGNQRDYQDVLHLQRTDEGAYYVALFPRRRKEPAPEFECLGDGTIIKTTGPFGADYGFLSAEPVESQAGKVEFQGTAASVQDRSDGLVLSLGAGGEVSYGEYRLESSAAATATFSNNKATVSVSHDRREDQIITLTVPRGDRLVSSDKKVGLAKTGDASYRIVMSKGVTTAALDIENR